MSGQWSRRRFLELVGAGAVAGAVPGAASAASSGLPERKLGDTGAKVSLLGLGGFHIGKPPEPLAMKLMHRAIDEGLTFFDNCWDYHEGESERRMGKALKGGRRDEVFLMTKIDGRTKDAAKSQLEDSLRRLQTDTIDLVQIHEVIRPEDPEWVFGPLGAVEVLRRAQEEGKLRFIGFTGHKDPKFHLAMLDKAKEEGFEFDTVQMPLNLLDAHYDSFEKRVLPRLERERLGVLGMKPLAGGHLLKGTGVDAKTALRYALGLPTSVVITGIESERDLEQALEVGRGFSPMSAKERRSVLAKTRGAAKKGEHELYKVSHRYDGTVKNPHWLSTARP